MKQVTAKGDQKKEGSIQAVIGVVYWGTQAPTNIILKFEAMIKI